MNSHWNESWIIFAMALVSTRFDSWIRVRVFGSTRDQLWVKLGQTQSKLLKISEKLRFEVKCEKCHFVRVRTMFDFWLNLGLTRDIFVILEEKVILGTSVPEQATSF